MILRLIYRMGTFTKSHALSYQIPSRLDSHFITRQESGVLCGHIMGASSGMGKELANILSGDDYIVGLAARRTDLLDELQKGLPNKSFIKQIDLSKPEDAEIKFKEMIGEMGGIDLVVISAGYGDLNSKLK